MRRLVKAIRNPSIALRRAWTNASNVFPETQSKIAREAGEFWRESAEVEAARDLSHWAGHGRWANATEWYRIGERHYLMFNELRQLAAFRRPVNTMVEWGPGGGANAIRFSSSVEKYYGVDISEPNLLECRRQLEQRQYHGFHPVLIPAERPENCLSAVSGGIDFFLSTAVYQHFPSKEYGFQVTKLAHQLLGPEALALIQIRYDNGRELFKSKHRDYRANAVTFTAYGISEFWTLAADVGFHPLATVLDTDTNYAFFYLRKGEHHAQDY